jgi:putative oxidoreductase
MATLGAERFRNELLLVARILLIVLFMVFGWAKLNNYDGTSDYMARTGLPMPSAAALAAIAVEVPATLAVAIGAWTRPLALLLAVYTLAAGLLGHPFWTTEGSLRYANAINFYKNVSIIGGFLLLYVTGPGRYSVDRWLGRSQAPLTGGAPTPERSP